MPLFESHPLQPFLPSNAKVLMLGSFPPQQKRWCMDFFYPNYQNDMWRIMGLLFFADRNIFIDSKAKSFHKDAIIHFLQETGIALYDTAEIVRRLRDNASDNFLEIVQHTNIEALLQHMPQCKAIATTGEKATKELTSHYPTTKPPIGGKSPFSSGIEDYNSIVCPPLQEPIRSPLTKKRPVIIKCSKNLE